jgi:ribosome-binding protein aMBF1 (putative translation factor)
MICATAHIIVSEVVDMTKSYAEYSAARRANMTEAGADAVEVFNRAFALGAIFAEARRQRGLNQTQLAQRSGVTQADISRIERGILAPTTPTLMRLAEGLNARISLELLAEPEPKPIRTPRSRSARAKVAAARVTN